MTSFPIKNHLLIFAKFLHYKYFSKSNNTKWSDTVLHFSRRAQFVQTLPVLNILFIKIYLAPTGSDQNYIQILVLIFFKRVEIKVERYFSCCIFRIPHSEHLMQQNPYFYEPSTLFEQVRKTLHSISNKSEHWLTSMSSI